MSHFVALVFISPSVFLQGEQAILAETTRLLVPYNLWPTPNQYNPHGTWDGWEIGGRWHGTVMGRASIDRNDGTFGGFHSLLAMNSCPVRDLDYDLVPFAVVTPDGIWHVEGKMQEFGFASNLDPYWEDKYDQLREQYGDCLAVVLDCHI
jgi:hypothetical protein